MATLVLLLGLVLGMASTSISAGSDDVGCGSAFHPSSSQADLRDYSDRIGDAMRGGLGVAGSDYVARCEDRVSAQRLIVFPLVGLSALALVFLFLTGQRATRWDTPATAPVDDEMPARQPEG